MGILNLIRGQKNAARARAIGRYAERSQYNEKEQIAELRRIEAEKTRIRADKEAIRKMKKQAWKDRLSGFTPAPGKITPAPGKKGKRGRAPAAARKKQKGFMLGRSEGSSPFELGTKDGRSAFELGGKR